ncbi:MAG: carbohydrate binding domain-containing protein [Candidatus Omnitrophica bacterium]|nr:carbohydrate binding domain-containing protein [Candidatus Omnitrophota bacterium]
MRSLHFLFAISFFLLLTNCAPAPKSELLIDSFEGELNKQTVDHGAAAGSSVTVSADTSSLVCGAQSLKIDYELKEGGYMWIARGYNLDVKGAAAWLVEPGSIDWKKYNAISVQVFGSNTGGIIAFDVKDAGGEIWRYLIDDDFSGWKEIVCPFSSFFARMDWQPDTAKKNEILDTPLKSFQFEPKTAGKGSLRIDCVKLTKIKNAK